MRQRDYFLSPDRGEGPCAPPIARGIQNRPPNLPAVQAGSTRPGFMMPLGSSTALMDFITSMATGSL